jgi:hypothetical protein
MPTSYTTPGDRLSCVHQVHTSLRDIESRDRVSGTKDSERLRSTVPVSRRCIYILGEGGKPESKLIDGRNHN